MARFLYLIDTPRLTQKHGKDEYYTDHLTLLIISAIIFIPFGINTYICTNQKPSLQKKGFCSSIASQC